MAGKRKTSGQRKSLKPRTKKNKTEEEDLPTIDDSVFTKEEEEEAPLSTHIRRSRKQSPNNSRSNNAFTKEEEEEPLSTHIRRSPAKTKKIASCFKDVGYNDKGEDISADDEEKDVVWNDMDGNVPAADEKNEIVSGAESDDDEINNSEEKHTSKYEVRQRVLARDEDGILYYANIRRKLYGINHQKSISCLGIFDLAPEDLVEKNATSGGGRRTEDAEGEEDNNDDDESKSNNQNEWHYFVHYEGWKTLWDRWVSESAILDVTPDNLERMKQISKAHKELQLEFKEKTKKRKIENGGLFLQQWKQRLDALNQFWDKKVQEKDAESTNHGSGKTDKSSVAKRRKKLPKKKTARSSQEILRDRSKLVVQTCLTTREASHIQAIPLSFSLKRILVEDWENLNNSNFATDSDKKDTLDIFLKGDMVHVLPAKVTIRYALSLYLKEKGISWDGKTKDELSSKSSNGQPTSSENEASSKNDRSSKQTQGMTSTNQIEKVPSDSESAKCQSKKSVNIIQNGSTPSGKDSKLLNDETNLKVEEQSESKPNHDNDDDDNGISGKAISFALVKEWTDMADGIVFYFEQALIARLLYPSEISQIFVLEDSMADENSDESMEKAESVPLKVDIYGCEHLLRLLAAIPRILDQHLQDSRRRKLEQKQKKTRAAETVDERATDEDNAFVEIGSMILAKLQDLSRFLQKNQSTLFRSMYRKKNEEEIKYDVKIQKRQERRLKSAAAAAAVAAAVEASQNDLLNLEE